MKGKRILVTGGCGFIGSNFVRSLLTGAEKHRPALLVNADALTYAGNPGNLNDLREDPGYRFEKADIGDEERMFNILRGNAIDTVVNFAAESHVDRSIDTPEPFFMTNVIGTVRLLNAFRRHWTELGKPERHRFLHVSTDEVYGTLAEEEPAFTETTPFAPNSPYAASKASSNHAVRSFHRTYGAPTLIANASNTYGPFQFPEKLIPLVILNALENRPLPLYGDGRQIRDWLFVEDHVEAACRILLEGRVGETYNVGGSNQIRNREVVESIGSLLDRKRPRDNGESYRSLIRHVEDRPGHDRRYALNCSKIERELGWSPKVPFSSGLEQTVDWYVTHQAWAYEVSRGKYARERLGFPRSSASS